MILRLQTEEELAALQQKLKAKLPSRIHLNELRTDTGTEFNKEAWEAQKVKTYKLQPDGVIQAVNASRKPHKGPRATFEHKLLSRQLTQAQIAFREEFRFEPKRRWRFDFMVDAFPTSIGIEIVGGLWLKRGGHSGGQAQLDDMEKGNHAAKLGYRILQFSPQQVKDGEAIGFIEQVVSFANEGECPRKP